MITRARRLAAALLLAWAPLALCAQSPGPAAGSAAAAGPVATAALPEPAAQAAEVPAGPAASPAERIPGPDAASLRIGVVTMQPGEIFFERFGHDAIVVDDPALGEPLSYNFGFFDLTEPGFIGRFVDNAMQYRLVVLPLADDLAYYRDTGRGVSIQWLDLTESEASTLAARLAANARPENAQYRYEYFTDNCATRVRDALDATLGGTLRPQLEVRSTGNTFRSEAVRLASPATWMWLGFDIGLGPLADQPNSLWQDAFVPMRLADGLRRAKRTDGRPLVRSEHVLLPHRIAPEPQPRAWPWWPWLLSGMALAALATLAARRAPRAVATVATAFWLACGVLGALMLFIWLGTGHTYGHGNHNLLLFNPLALLLVHGGVALMRGRPPGRLFAPLLLVLALCVGAALFLQWLPLLPQRNAHWIALLLPIHLGLLTTFAVPRALPR